MRLRETLTVHIRRWHGVAWCGVCVNSHVLATVAWLLYVKITLTSPRREYFRWKCAAGERVQPGAGRRDGADQRWCIIKEALEAALEWEFGEQDDQCSNEVTSLGIDMW